MTGRHRGWIAALLLLAHGASAHAGTKPVELQWEPIARAKGYELEVRPTDAGQTRAKRVKTNASRWRGELTSGVYVYRIRAIDALGRPGQWSGHLSLVVTHVPPSPKLPESGARVSRYDWQAPVVFEWAAESFEEFVFELTEAASERPRERRRVKGTRVEIAGLAPGEYRWSVRGIERARTGARLPASIIAELESQGGNRIDQRTWEGPPGATATLSLQNAVLPAPRVVGPKAAFYPPADRRVELSWAPVEGAQAYEVEFAGKRVRVSDTRLQARCPRDGTYRWRVRALASVSTQLPERAADLSQGGSGFGLQSQADFQVDRSLVFNEGSGFVALSGLYAPYRYELESPRLGVRGNTRATQSSVRISGEYFPFAQWGIGLAVENSALDLEGQRIDLGRAELHAKYRFSLDGSRTGWSVLARLGAESRDYAFVTPRNGQFGVFEGWSKFGTLGPALGVDVRKQFSDRLSVALKLGYYLPVRISGAPGGGKLSGSEQFTNAQLGLQGAYWWTSRWGVALGALVDYRRVSYRSEGGNSNAFLASVVPRSSGVERIRNDGVYFFGSVIYRLGSR